MNAIRNSLLVLVLMLSGCGPFHRQPIVNEELRPYLDKYLDYKEQQLGTREYHPMDIMFVSLDDTSVGRCYWYPRMIQIDQEYWDIASEKSRESLMFHELGHCDLDRDHSNPDSLMEAYLINAFKFAQNELYYIQELFEVTATKTLAISKKIYYHGGGGHYGEGTNITCGSNRVRQDNIRKDISQ